MALCNMSKSRRQDSKRFVIPEYICCPHVKCLGSGKAKKKFLTPTKNGLGRRLLHSKTRLRNTAQNYVQSGMKLEHEPSLKSSDSTAIGRSMLTPSPVIE